MLIKKRPIITWLLHPDSQKLPDGILLPEVANPMNYPILNQQLAMLDNIRIQKPIWELPELLMPSFEEVMNKSILSFEKIMPKLFKEFSEQNECGILLCKKNVTLVYGFENNKLHLWFFIEDNGKSVFRFYSCNECVGRQTKIGIIQTLIYDDILFKGSIEERENFIGSVSNFIASYVAVKRYVKVETVVIPQGKYTEIEGTLLEYVDKKKVINQTGQKVIVMDSKWFRKIVNDNDIYVRGFWKMQPKKNADGKWYKELIFIDSHIRHGYHRNAKIEDDM